MLRGCYMHAVCICKCSSDILWQLVVLEAARVLVPFHIAVTCMHAAASSGLLADMLSTEVCLDMCMCMGSSD
jgi:hypothetical protein